MAIPESDTKSVDAEEQEKPKLALETKIDTSSACQRHVTVTIQRPDIDRYFKEAFDELTPKAEVPGFRPGRAPRKIVESKFRDQMRDQVKSSLLSDAITQISDGDELSAISEPDFDFEVIELPDEGAMTFEFDIEVRPDFETPEWKGLKLKRPTYEYSDDEVSNHLNGLLERYGRVIEREDDVCAGDTVSLNIRFFDESQPDESQPEASQPEASQPDEPKLVSEIQETVKVLPKLSFWDANLDGFDTLLVGAKKGDKRETAVEVSDKATSEEFRGKELKAEFEVQSVKRVELPELTPAFLDRIGGFDDEAELRDTVREELERQLAYYQNKRIREQITGILTKEANWELPPDLLQRQSRRELERAVLELRSSGFDESAITAYSNQIRQNSLESTERALKEHFIFERIAEDEEIEAESDDFDLEVRRIAAQSQDSPRRVRARLEKRGQMDALRNQIVEQKVLDLIISEADFTDTPFEPQRDDETAAINHAVSGNHGDVEIPEAKYGGDAEQLPGTVERD